MVQNGLWQIYYMAQASMMECLRLRVKGIEFDYSQIIVRDAKGSKDRITILPTLLFKKL